MNFCDEQKIKPFFQGKSVALVGSGPSSLLNQTGFVDSHDTVVRVNNYKLTTQTGFRTDVFYSYFGGAIKKTQNELLRDGVKLCISKCPNLKFMESEWHTRHGKNIGVDFRYIYEKRKDWWFCDTYVVSLEEFMSNFQLLNNHLPTTGFSAIITILKHNPKSLYLTGFDFFESKIHNLNEPWRKINNDDPICHTPEAEKLWIIENRDKYPLLFDKQLSKSLKGV